MTQKLVPPIAGELLVETGALQGHRIPLDQPGLRLVIGREPPAQLVFASERVVSKLHAQLEITSDGIFVSDLNSTNKTYLNGVAVRERVPVQSGSRIRLGTDGPSLLITWERKGGERPLPFPAAISVAEPFAYPPPPPRSPSVEPPGQAQVSHVPGVEPRRVGAVAGGAEVSSSSLEPSLRLPMPPFPAQSVENRQSPMTSPPNSPVNPLIAGGSKRGGGIRLNGSFSAGASSTQVINRRSPLSFPSPVPAPQGHADPTSVIRIPAPSSRALEPEPWSASSMPESLTGSAHSQAKSAFPFPTDGMSQRTGPAAPILAPVASTDSGQGGYSFPTLAPVIQTVAPPPLQPELVHPQGSTFPNSLASSTDDGGVRTPSLNAHSPLPDIPETAPPSKGSIGRAWRWFEQRSGVTVQFALITGVMLLAGIAGTVLGLYSKPPPIDYSELLQTGRQQDTP